MIKTYRGGFIDVKIKDDNNVVQFNAIDTTNTYFKLIINSNVYSLEYEKTDNNEIRVFMKLSDNNDIPMFSEPTTEDSILTKEITHVGSIECYVVLKDADGNVISTNSFIIEDVVLI